MVLHGPLTSAGRTPERDYFREMVVIVPLMALMLVVGSGRLAARRDQQGSQPVL